MIKYISIVFFLPIFLYGQVSSLEQKGNAFFEVFSYKEAIEKYAAADLTMNGRRKLAICYERIGDLEKASSVYEKICQDATATSSDYLRYSHVLRKRTKYEAANKWYEKYAEGQPMLGSLASYRELHDRFPKTLQDNGKYVVHKLKVNSADQDFGLSYYGDKVVFASSRKRASQVKRKYNWDGMAFLDMYVATRKGNQIEEPVPFRTEFNNKLHEGPASFDSTGKFMAFTRNNVDKISKIGKNGELHLKIFFAQKDNEGQWKKASAFKVNSTEYSVGHPWLSKDGNKMYFSSDMPGGLGGADIYLIEKDADGKWGEAVNLEYPVNTEGDELFPFFHEESSYLYFASNGHLGVGGLDVFSVKREGRRSHEELKNLGAPINTPYDDFSLVINAENTQGYFSSNRKGGKGSDDIYSFDIIAGIGEEDIVDETIDKDFEMSGILIDDEGGPLDSVKILLLDIQGNVIDSVYSNEEGLYEYTSDKDIAQIVVEQEGYLTYQRKVSKGSISDLIDGEIMLFDKEKSMLYAGVVDDRTGRPIKGARLRIYDMKAKRMYKGLTGDEGRFFLPLEAFDIGDSLQFDIDILMDGYKDKELKFEAIIDRFRLRNMLVSDEDIRLELLQENMNSELGFQGILFDYKSYGLSAEAKKELDKVVTYMNEHKSVQLELGAHTDCRGGAEYNEKLSSHRAAEAAKYIRSRITNPGRLSGKGYGESQLLVDCPCEGTNESECPEEEHLKNRRVVFKVVGHLKGDEVVPVSEIGYKDIVMETIKSNDGVVQDLRDLMAINEIYFEYKSIELTKASRKELDKVVGIMSDYPEMRVELGAHTDCRGGYTYNKKLSAKRAKAAAAYIKERIQGADRIVSKGYGETQLLTDCPCEGTNESNCSEEEHAKNRRTEFKILHLGDKNEESDVLLDINDDEVSTTSEIMPPVNQEEGFNEKEIVGSESGIHREADQVVEEVIEDVDNVDDVIPYGTQKVVDVQLEDVTSKLQVEEFPEEDIEMVEQLLFNDEKKEEVVVIKEDEESVIESTFVEEKVEKEELDNNDLDSDFEMEDDEIEVEKVEEDAKEGVSKVEDEDLRKEGERKDISEISDKKFIREILAIGHITYDYKSSKVNDSTALELDKVISVLRDYADLRIEVGAHTDCRGSMGYNKKLSSERAQSCANYIKARIYNPERVSYNGYGESRLISDCPCEGDRKSFCSEADHARNRRTVFKIIK